MAETAVRNGTELFLNTEVTGIDYSDDVFEVETTKGTFKSRYVLSATGVYSDAVRNLVEEPTYEIVPTRGQYFLLDKDEGSRVSCTIFQCPNEKGKGVLVSPTVDGNLIVGPDANVGLCDDTSTDKPGLDAIKAAAVKSVPDINFRMNIKHFAGVRSNSNRDDFVIEKSEKYPRFIDIACIKSPGLTAAPAIGEYVVGTGRIICRCESITEGEIVAALHTPIPPTTINGVKRRVGSGMGRCQGGFCTPKVHEIISRELGIDMLEVCLEEPGSEILKYRSKNK